MRPVVFAGWVIEEYSEQARQKTWIPIGAQLSVGIRKRMEGRPFFTPEPRDAKRGRAFRPPALLAFWRSGFLASEFFGWRTTQTRSSAVVSSRT